MPNTSSDKPRGHWPKGVPRNRPANWSQTRRKLQSLIDAHYCKYTCCKEVIARELGVSARALSRWLTGAHVPSLESAAALETWVAAKLAAVAATKRQSRRPTKRIT